MSDNNLKNELQINDIKKELQVWVKEISERLQNAGGDIKEAAIKVIDENGNGEIDIVDFIVKSLKLPFVHVNRDEYLRTNLKKYCDDETILKAIETSPIIADVSKENIEKIAKNAISVEEVICASSSLILGYIPGGIVVQAGTTIVDITQYYAHLLVVMQKLMYLYGFPQLDLDKGKIDDETLNMIIIGVGAMVGVGEATKLIGVLVNKLAENVPKIIVKKALTKNVAYQVTKKVVKYIGIKLNKNVFAKFIGNAIVFVGGAALAGITHVTFASSCNNFFKAIKESPFAEEKHYESNIIDIDVDELDKEIQEEMGEIEGIEEE